MCQTYFLQSKQIPQPVPDDGVTVLSAGESGLKQVTKVFFFFGHKHFVANVELAAW